MESAAPNARASEPRDEYARRLRARQDDRRRLSGRYDVVSHLRVATAALAIALAWWSLGAHRIHPVWIAVPVVAFAALVVVHEGIARRRTRAERAIAYHERALARLEHRWMGQGVRGERFRDEGHPYAAHLDLFGKGSLFELLCTARTRAGEDTLAAWLLEPCPPAAARERQQSIDELRSRLDLREALALAGEEYRLDREAAQLVSWGTRPSLRRLGLLRLAVLAIAFAALAAGSAWGLGLSGPLPLATVVLIEFGVVNLLRRRVDTVLLRGAGALDELQLMARVLACLQQQQLSTPLSARLQQQLVGAHGGAARRIAALGRRFEALDAARNQLVAPVAALLLWRTQMALWIEQWRAQWGTHIGPWLQALGQLEALVALSGYAYEHPGDPFAELVDDGPAFVGMQLGHPLLPRERCVRNDVSLAGERRLLVVSGSNMSGKSTLLRTVGVNAVLAQAGAPVSAAQPAFRRWPSGVHLGSRLAAGRHLPFLCRDQAAAAIADAVRRRPPCCS